MEEFTLQSRMQDVERLFPYARSSLRSGFHIGGCAKCGYEPNESIEEVAQKYSKDPNTLVSFLNEERANMNDCEISLDEFKTLQAEKEKLLLVDVREEWEYNIAHLPNSIRLTESNFKSVVEQSKQVSQVIVICHHGMRSMNATLYFRENGVKNARSLAGGIDAYSLHVDKSLQRY
jgi:rhodanese-related sulfurtransferase